jgi:xanthine dehydrogenase accessory factor
MMRVWARLRESLDRHGRAAMVTVVSTKGSAPREAGARLVVNPDGTFVGTIGGGTLEWRAIALGQAALAGTASKRADLRRFALGPELGQCCGGQVEIVVELIGGEERAIVEDLAAREAAGVFVTRGCVSADRGVAREVVGGMSVPPGSAVWRDGVLIEGFGDGARPLLLFGAGHVGRALILALAQLPFAVTWVDPRLDAFPAYLPKNATAVRLDDPESAVRDAPSGSFVLVMTHSHPLDLALVGAALADDRFPYVGLIGSRSKRARFEHMLRDAGTPPERIAQLVCPIGVDGIKSKAPAVIAAATVAQLLMRDEALRAAAAPNVATHDQPRRRPA